MSLTLYFYADVDDAYPLDIDTINITHNLVPMAKAAGLYEVVWRPDELASRQLRDLRPALLAGIDRMVEHAEKLKQLAPSNGWGTYESFMRALHQLLWVANTYPLAYVSPSR